MHFPAECSFGSVLKRLFKVLLLILLFYPLNSKGQFDKEFTINNGLPHTGAFCTVQDSNGFLWFGTLDGLCKYDGAEMQVFRNERTISHSITNNRIQALVLDSTRNGLWIGTEGGGLNFMDLATEKFFPIELKKTNQAGTHITAIKQTGPKEIYVATTTRLYRLELADEVSYKPKAVHIIHLTEESPVTTIYQDKHQGIWLGTSLQLLYKPFNKSDFSQVTALNYITSFADFDPHNMLVGSLNGIFKVHLEDFGVEKISPLQTVSLLWENACKIWVGTRSQGLYLINSRGNQVKSYDSANEMFEWKSAVQHIFMDKNSCIFAATAGSGIKVLYNVATTFTTYPKSDAKAIAALKKPICFYSSQKDPLIYIGVHAGLAAYDRKTGQIAILPISKKPLQKVHHKEQDQSKGLQENANMVTAIFRASNHSFWIGGVNQLYRMGGTRTLSLNNLKKYMKSITLSYNHHYRINKIREDANQRIWTGTTKGVFCFDQDGKELFSSKDLRAPAWMKEINGVTDILLEKGNNNTLGIWVATTNGLYKLTLNNNSLIPMKHLVFKREENFNSLFSNWVSLLHKDRNEALWAGTIGGGLSRISRDKDGNYRFKTFTTREGLLSNDIETLQEDEGGHFWIGGLGLTRFNPEKGSFTYFDATDGLQSNAFKVWSAFKEPDGEMIFGGINGFNIFYPRDIKRKIDISEPILTKLLVNNRVAIAGLISDNNSAVLEKTLAYTSNLELRNDQKNISIEFSSIHSRDFQKITYRYKMVGYDKDWIYVKSDKRFATYTNLPAGNYKFEVAASGGGGVWKKNSTPLLIKVHPAFLQSKIAYLLYGLAFVGLCLYIKRSVSQKHKLNIERTKRIEELKSYDDKIQFFTNISHELRTPLTLISSPIEQILSNSKHSKEIRDKLAIAHKNTFRLQRLIEQILDIRKLELGKITFQPEPTGLEALLYGIYIQFIDIAKKNKVSFSCENHIVKTIRIDRFKMEQVLMNILSNAFKFTPINGSITITTGLDKNTGTLRINIKNSGSYITAEELVKICQPFYKTALNNSAGTGLGLTISKYLVELHNGEMGISSAKEGSEYFTTFSISLPVMEEELRKEASVATKKREEEKLPKDTETILVVDDNEEFLHIMEDIFAEDYYVTTCSNGSEALNQIKKKKPSIVITDVMMPVMDGIDLCRKIKKGQSTNDIPVIMLTANATESSKLAGLKAMANDYITKPFHLKELHFKINNLLKERSAVKTTIQNNLKLNPTEVKIESRNDQLIRNVIDCIEKNMDDQEYNVDRLCREIGISRPVLYRKVKQLTGMSIQIFILEIRLKRAAQLLQTNQLSISEVMYETGFSSLSYFSTSFKNKFNCTPSMYKKGSEPGIN